MKFKTEQYLVYIKYLCDGLNKCKFEQYLEAINYFEIHTNITRLRISAHNLHIETGRHKCPSHVPINQRIRDKFKITENDFHFIMNCDQFTAPTHVLVKKLQYLFIDVTTFRFIME